MPRKGNAAPTPCPSVQAYWRHIDHGQEPCEGCREAKREHDHALRPTPTRFLGPGECGTVRGYRWHRKQGEEQCQPCKDAITAAQRGQYTPAPRELEPCGSGRAAYDRHIRHRETPCDACRAANSDATRIERQTRRIVAAMTRQVAA